MGSQSVGVYTRPPLGGQLKPGFSPRPPGAEERVWSLFRALYRDSDVAAIRFELHFVELVPEATTVADVEIFPVRGG